MSDKDKLHNFISGMQGWAQNELRRQNNKDFIGSIAAADSLVDFRTTRPTTDVPSTLKSKKKGDQKGVLKGEIVKTMLMIGGKYHRRKETKKISERIRTPILKVVGLVVVLIWLSLVQIGKE